MQNQDLTADQTRDLRALAGFIIPPSAAYGVFDRVLIHGLLDTVPAEISALVSQNGVVVFARFDSAGQGVLIRRCDEKTGGWAESALGPCRAGAMIPGKSTTF